MFTPHPARPPHPPPGAVYGESDENLAFRLRGRAESDCAPSVALLLARHWEPVRAFAALCLTPSGNAADMACAAAFHQVLDRVTRGEPALALRPLLLGAVRDTAARWPARERTAGTRRARGRSATDRGGTGRPSAESATARSRGLAERSFHLLTPMDRCLLWHTEVEGEPVEVPAALLGMDAGAASLALDQARQTFRAGCVQAHRDLAPTKDCRFYNRLLDIPIRRGGPLLPDVRLHLARCSHCRDAAEELSLFQDDPGALMAEALLGRDAGRYRDARRERAREEPRNRGAARHGGGRRRPLGSPSATVRRTPSGRLPSRALLTGAAVACAGLLAALLAAGPWPSGDGAEPAASTGAPGVSGAPGTARLPTAPGRTRLRNAAAGLCLGVRGAVRAGAATELSSCSSAGTQRWSYEDDGLLRSAAAPGLCLDSRAAAGVAVLGGCAAERTERADDVRYDLTVRGELLPRRQERLALASTTGDAGADVVVSIRDGSTAQRWLTDAASGRFTAPVHHVPRSRVRPEGRRVPHGGQGAPHRRVAADAVDAR